MKIALDYDKTFTADPTLWTEFIKSAKIHLHTITFVTYRYEPDEGFSTSNDDIKEVAKSLDIAIIFTNGEQKASMFSADIWIDDAPVTIPTADELNDQGCCAVD